MVDNPRFAHAEGEARMDGLKSILVIVAVLAAWILLQKVILPKMGIST